MIERRIEKHRRTLEKAKGKRSATLRMVKDCKRKVKRLSKEARDIEKAQTIIRRVAQSTQKELEYHVAELVSLALGAVFPNPYEVKLDFVLRRKGTEADIKFVDPKTGEEFNPMDASGGGVINVTAFALRVCCWSLQRPRSRNTLLLDEPFKDINDPNKKLGLHKKASEMVKRLSEELNLQIIMISLDPDLIECADKVFEVTKSGKVSKVEEYNAG